MVQGQWSGGQRPRRDENVAALWLPLVAPVEDPREEPVDAPDEPRAGTRLRRPPDRAPEPASLDSLRRREAWPEPDPLDRPPRDVGAVETGATTGAP